jgi:hypothetical protein
VMYRINNDLKQRLALLVPKKLVDRLIMRMLGGAQP